MFSKDLKNKKENNAEVTPTSGESVKGTTAKGTPKLTNIEKHDMEANFRVFGHVIKLKLNCVIGKDSSLQVRSFLNK
jgi:hypothetical protein